MQQLRARLPDRNDGPEGRSLGERCVLAFGNSSGRLCRQLCITHMQIVQSPGYVSIMVEMVHDTRIIRIADSRDAVAASLDKWMGDSIGRWEGDTLIVETKHYNLSNVSRRAHRKSDRDRDFPPRRAKQDHLWFYGG